MAQAKSGLKVNRQSGPNHPGLRTGQFQSYSRSRKIQKGITGAGLDVLLIL